MSERGGRARSSRSRWRWGATLAGLLAASAAVAGDGATVEVTANGRPFVGRTQPVGPPDGPRDLDLLHLSPFVLTRGSVERPAFEASDRHRMFEIGSDGARTLVAVSVRVDDADPESATELFSLDAAQLAGLRGLRVNGWSDRLHPVLARLDFTRCALDIDLPDEGPFPTLPEGVRLLSVDPGFGLDELDLRPLAGLKELRALWLQSGPTFDLAALGELPALEVLGLSLDPEMAKTLPDLRQLHTLQVIYAPELTDLSFVRRVPALRRLDLTGSAVTDLTPLAELAHLREVDASLSPIETLPVAGFAALRKLRLLSHRIPPEALTAFVQAHPECLVVHDWKGQLEAAAADGTALRVRSGGAGADPARTGVLYASDDVADLRAFLATLEIEDRTSGGHCMCLGGPTVEMLQGERVVVSLSIHHGVGMRWAHGPWPGDAAFTKESAATFCDWLAVRGVAGPKRARDESIERQAATQRARVAEVRLLGADRASALRAAEETEDEMRLIRAWSDDEAERVRLCMRLHAIGVRVDSGLLEQKAARYLDAESSSAARMEAVDAFFATEDDALVAARYFLSRPDADEFPAEWFAAARLRAGRVLVASEDDGDRRDGVHLLGGIASGEAEAALLTALPDVPADGQEPAPSDEIVCRAAIYLASFCGAEHLPRLRRVVGAHADAEMRVFFESRLEREIADREPVAESPAPR